MALPPIDGKKSIAETDRVPDCLTRPNRRDLDPLPCAASRDLRPAIPACHDHLLNAPGKEPIDG